MVTAIRPSSRFYATSSPLPLAEAVALAGASLEVPGEGSPKVSPKISHVAPVDAAGAGAVVFAQAARDLPTPGVAGPPALLLTRKAAVEAAATVFPGTAIATLANPKAGFAALGEALHQSLAERDLSEAAGVSPTAQIAASARIAPSAIIMAGAEIGEGVVIGPYAVIGPGVVIGAGSFIGSHSTVTHTLMGKDCRLSAGARVGEVGFGYVTGPDGARRVPQLGRVVLEDRVDIGANSAVDRGALGDTVIGTGTKIDNLAQIAHNCQLGRDVFIVSQVGISGSCKIGDGAILAGQAGVADHVTIGAGAVINAKAGVMKDVPAGEQWGGLPARPARQWLKDAATLSKLSKKEKR